MSELRLRRGSRRDSMVDTSKAEKEFGWKAEMTVGEYIEHIRAEK